MASSKLLLIVSCVGFAFNGLLLVVPPDWIGTGKTPNTAKQIKTRRSQAFWMATLFGILVLVQIVRRH
jgi:hypothetical protein